VAVYTFCKAEGPLPVELEMAWMVERYGAPSVIGRVLGVGEMRKMALASRVYNAYQSRQSTKDWVEWAKQYPSESGLLNEVMRGK